MMPAAELLFVQLGLSEIEAKVYLASLSTGPASVQDIAKKAGVSRTAGYDAINSLREKSLFSTFNRGNRSMFAAEPPDRLIAYFSNKQHERDTLMLKAKQLVPELYSVLPGDKPFVRFYEGKEAVRIVFEDFAASGATQIDELANLDDAKDILFNTSKELHEVFARSKHLIKPEVVVRLLVSSKASVPVRPGVRARQIPDTIPDFHADMWIYGDRIALVSFVGQVMTIIVQSEIFSTMMRAMYEVAWSASKPYHPSPAPSKE